MRDKDNFVGKRGITSFHTHGYLDPELSVGYGGCP